MSYRIIYSLEVDLLPSPVGVLRQLIVPLLPDGTATIIRPVSPKTRAIDLRSGDQFVYQGKREVVAGISAYRDAYTNAAPARRDGYVYRCRTKAK